MNERQKQILKAEIAGIEGAWVLVSGYTCQDRPGATILPAVSVSFIYDNGKGVAAEWGPPFGPLQLWIEAKEGEGEEHYYFDRVTSNSAGQWSQIDVDENWLVKDFVTGNFRHIFYVLKEWTRDVQGE